MKAKDQLRIFISHTKKDKEFARDLASQLRILGYRVWFDDWEIAVGDSIVEKVFDGLRGSDTLIIVLSPTSVESRRVSEELNVVVMRRILESNIRILPVLIETCELPVPLTHIRYADFRGSHVVGMSSILEALSPCHLLWKSLAQHYDHFCILADQVVGRELDETVVGDILKILDLLDTALDLRTEIELRRAGQQIRNLNFYEKIGFLVDSGLDVRSQTWNTFHHHPIEHRNSCCALGLKRVCGRLSAESV